MERLGSNGASQSARISAPTTAGRRNRNHSSRMRRRAALGALAGESQALPLPELEANVERQHAILDLRIGREICEAVSIPRA